MKLAKLIRRAGSEFLCVGRSCWAAALTAALLAGCAFDISHVSQKPTTFTPSDDGPSFLLVKQVKAKLGTGYPTLLKTNTTWRPLGVTHAGRVYATHDQVVKVEASNIYEAYLVVSNQFLTGFYLPVEKTFAPLGKPLPLETRHLP